jgi:hypothetical protein
MSCAQLFKFSASCSSEMQFGMLYLKTWVSTQPHIAFWTLNFIVCLFIYLFISGRTHTAPYPLPFQRSVFVVSCFIFNWGKNETCFPCLVAWVQGTLHDSCIRSLTHVSLISPCKNVEPQKARMIKLLWMVRSTKWKNSSFFQFHGCLCNVTFIFHYLLL